MTARKEFEKLGYEKWNRSNRSLIYILPRKEPKELDKFVKFDREGKCVQCYKGDGALAIPCPMPGNITHAVAKQAEEWGWHNDD